MARDLRKRKELLASAPRASGSLADGLIKDLDDVRIAAALGVVGPDDGCDRPGADQAAGRQGQEMFEARNGFHVVHELVAAGRLADIKPDILTKNA